MYSHPACAAASESGHLLSTRHHSFSVSMTPERSSTKFRSLFRSAITHLQCNDGGIVLKIRIIPCLDVKDGRVVKGVNFVGLRDAGDPVEQAMIYDAAGADELCFLDITASHEKRGILLDI